MLTAFDRADIKHQPDWKTEIVRDGLLGPGASGQGVKVARATAKTLRLSVAIWGPEDSNPACQWLP
ncbi:MAG: hypothetical protein ABJF23_30255 [Bryobacteraceae bacterium]